MTFITTVKLCILFYSIPFFFGTKTCLFLHIPILSYRTDAHAYIDRLSLRIDVIFYLFMLVVLTVSTNHIRKELCHCAIIGIMQIVTRQHFVITTLIHGFPFLLLVHSEARAGFSSFMWRSLLSVTTVCCFYSIGL